jgi:hypothetical protein
MLEHVVGILLAIILAILKVLPLIIFYHLAMLKGNHIGNL